MLLNHTPITWADILVQIAPNVDLTIALIQLVQRVVFTGLLTLCAWSGWLVVYSIRNLRKDKE